MFRRILIANRGEIALRIMRACRELSIETVCVFSEEDRGAHYLALADRTVCIGGAAPRDSYLQETAIGDPAAIDGPLGRGDVVFLLDHVGFMVDDAILVHANATAMCVSCDPVREVAKRVAKAEGRGITAVRRLSGP